MPKRKKMSKLQKKRNNENSSYWNKKAMAMWGAVVHFLWEDNCVMHHRMDCAGRPEAHHLVSRSVRSARHDPRNGIILCSKHHKFCPLCSPHMGPVGFIEAMNRRFPNIILHSKTHNTRPLVAKSYKECHDELEQLLVWSRDFEAQEMRRVLGMEPKTER